MNRPVASVLGWCCLLALGGCDKQVPQEITGTLVLATGPASETRLRLYESFEECSGNYIETRTDAAGAFKFNTESTRGGISVVTQTIALCTEDAGTWQPLWSIVTEGGAPEIVLTCKPPQGEGEYCDAYVTPCTKETSHDGCLVFSSGK